MLSLQLNLQVSVRRVGLQTAAKLVKELPCEPAVAHLWVRAVLPMVGTSPSPALVPLAPSAPGW